MKWRSRRRGFQAVGYHPSSNHRKYTPGYAVSALHFSPTLATLEVWKFRSSPNLSVNPSLGDQESVRVLIRFPLASRTGCRRMGGFTHRRDQYHYTHKGPDGRSQQGGGRHAGSARKAPRERTRENRLRRRQCISTRRSHPRHPCARHDEQPAPVRFLGGQLVRRGGMDPAHRPKGAGRAAGDGLRPARC